VFPDETTLWPMDENPYRAPQAPPKAGSSNLLLNFFVYLAGGAGLAVYSVGVWQSSDRLRLAGFVLVIASAVPGWSSWWKKRHSAPQS
jgi:hypothetical protein